MRVGLFCTCYWCGRVNPKKKWSVESRIQSLCAAEVQLKEFAQRVSGQSVVTPFNTDHSIRYGFSDSIQHGQVATPYNTQAVVTAAQIDETRW